MSLSGMQGGWAPSFASKEAGETCVLPLRVADRKAHGRWSQTAPVQIPVLSLACSVTRAGCPASLSLTFHFCEMEMK